MKPLELFTCKNEVDDLWHEVHSARKYVKVPKEFMMELLMDRDKLFSQVTPYKPIIDKNGKELR